MPDQVISIAIIKDDAPTPPSSDAITEALTYAAQSLNVRINIDCVPSPQLENDAETTLARYHALCAPGGPPYRSLDGALAAIRFAREHGVPFIGTCGGFQVAAIEYARNVIGLKDAQHVEYNPSAENPFISRLNCSLVGQTMPVKIDPTSKVYHYYGLAQTTEQYRCTMGLTPENQQRLDQSGFRIVGVDATNSARILELPTHPFFVTTLFVPQMNLAQDHTHPLVQAYLKAAVDFSRSN